MRHCVDTHPPARMWTPVLPFLALLCAVSLVAQKSPDAVPPKYDVQTEAKMKGSVDDVRNPPKGAAKEVVHLSVKSGSETVDVYLCPQAFLDDMGMSFSKGDEVVITGSKVKQGEADLVLAREVAKGTDTLVLRDGKGNPIWSWRH
jgi:hypothetical protein